MEKIHLKEVEALHLYGRRFDGLKLADLAPGLTVVYGPNGSGKSTLGRAIRFVFSSSKAEDRGDFVSASLTAGSQFHPVKLIGADKAPAWPQSARAGLYSLSIHDIIEGPCPEDDQVVASALSGGVDLAKILPSSGSNPPAGLRQKLEALDALENQGREAAKGEAKLADLALQIERASEDSRDHAVLGLWIKAAEAEDQAASLLGEAESLVQDHPGLEKQGSQAWELAASRLDALAKEQATLREATLALEPYQGRTSPGPLAAHDLEAASRILARRRELETLIPPARSEAIQARAEAERKKAALPGSALAAALLPDEVQELELLDRQLAEKEEALRQRSADAEAASRSLKDKRQLFRQEQGSEETPAEGPTREAASRAAELDQPVRDARMRADQAKRDLDSAQDRHYQIKSLLPGIALPSQEVLSRLTGEPSLAVLGDQAREDEVQKEGLRRAAGLLEQKAEEGKAQAAGASQASLSLKGWLASIPESSPEAQPSPLIWAAAVAGAVAALAAGYFGGWMAGSLAGAAAALLTAAIAWFVRPPQASVPDARQGYQSQTSDPWKPGQWTAQAVAEKLESALRKAAEAEALTSAAERARGAIPAGPSAAKDDLEARRSAFREATGVEAPESPYHFASLASRLANLASAELGLTEARSRWVKAEAEAVQLEGELKGILAPWPQAPRSGAAFSRWALALEALLEAEGSLAAALRDEDQARAAHDEAGKALLAWLVAHGWLWPVDPKGSLTEYRQWLADSASTLQLLQKADQREADLNLLLEEKHSLEAEGVKLMEEYGCPLAQGRPGHSAHDGLDPFIKWFTLSQNLRLAQEGVEQKEAEALRFLESQGAPPAESLADRAAHLKAREEVRVQRHSLLSSADSLQRDAQTKRDESGTDLLPRSGLTPSSPLETLRAEANRLAAVVEEVQALKDEESRIQERVKLAGEAAGRAELEREVDAAIAKTEEWLDGRTIAAANFLVREEMELAVERETAPPIVARTAEWLHLFTNGRLGQVSRVQGDLRVHDRIENRQKRVEELSTGSKAHLALAARLAVIEESERNGGYAFPLVVDEVLATSDEEATCAISSALWEISQSRQVILMTNQADDVKRMREACGMDVPVIHLQSAQPVPFEPPAAISQPELAEDTRRTMTHFPLHASWDFWPSSLAESLFGCEEETLGGAVLASPSLRPLAEALEEARRQVARAYPHVDWKEIQRAGIFSDLMEPRAHAHWMATGGQARRFADTVEGSIKGLRKDSVEKLQAWLSEKGCFQTPPTREEVVQTAFRALPSDHPYRRAFAELIAQIFQPYLAP